MGAAGARALASGLRGNSTLQRLNLLHNEVRPAPNKMREPQKCVARRCRQGREDHSMAPLWCLCARHALTLHALAFRVRCALFRCALARRRQVGDRGAEELADALRANSGLKHLNLQYNGLRTAAARALGARAVTRSFAQRTNRMALLREALHMQQSREKHALAPGQRSRGVPLTRPPALPAPLHPCALTRAGVALRHNATLEELDLQSNSIAGEGARYLAEALLVRLSPASGRKRPRRTPRAMRVLLVSVE